jgi:hypothetical protein
MQRTGSAAMTSRSLEMVLAVASVLASIAAAVRVWQVLPDRQPVWPFPGAYLVEVLVASATGALGIFRGDSPRSSDGTTLTWASIGVLAGFVLLGTWSIGAVYLPGVSLLLGAALLRDRRRRQTSGRHLGVGAIGALAQGALMLVVIALGR